MHHPATLTLTEVTMITHTNQPTNHGAIVLDQAVRFLARFLSAPEHVLNLMVLWAAHTHARNLDGSLATDTSPRMIFLSDKPGSGKTVALSLLMGLSRSASTLIDATPAGLATMISEGDTTIGLDETDILFGAGNAKSTLRSLINAGYKGGSVWRRSNKDVIPLFAPIAMAGLSTRWFASGDLEALRTRCLHITLAKAAGSAPIETYRNREHGPMMHALSGQLARWVDANLDAITEVFPAAPEGLHNRDAELCEPLLQVADAAGGHWPTSAREALLAVLQNETTEEEREADVPITHRLLADMQVVFAEAGNPPSLPTTDLTEGLLTLPNSPWSELWPNHGAVARELAALVAPLGLTPVNVRQGAKVLKGYKRASVAALVAELTAADAATDTDTDASDLDGELDQAV